MKGLGFSILLCAIVNIVLVVSAPPDWLPADMLDMVKPDKTRCMNEHGTTDAMVDDAAAGNLPNDPKITCYIYCLFEAFSLADEDGVLDKEMLIGILPENLQGPAEAAFGQCADEPGANPCEKMYNMAQCVIKRRPDMWFMI